MYTLAIATIIILLVIVVFYLGFQYVKPSGYQTPQMPRTQALPGQIDPQPQLLQTGQQSIQQPVQQTTQQPIQQSTGIFSGTFLEPERLVSRIHIEGRKDQPMNIAGFVVYNKNGDNVGVNGIASTSGPTWYNSPVEKILTQTNPSGYIDSSIMFHSQDPGAWWQLDFPIPVSVDHIDFFNRTDSGMGFRSSGMRVYVYDQNSQLIKSFLLNGDAKQVLRLD